MYISHLPPSAGSAALPPFRLPAQAATLESLFAAQPADKFAAGQRVVWEGDPVSDIFHIIDGSVRLYRILPDGRRAIIGFRFAGEMLGLACQGKHCYTAEAVTPLRLRRLRRARLLAFTEGAEQLQPLLMAGIFAEIRAAQQHIVVLGQLGAEERVAHFLVSAARRTGADRKRPAAIDLPMTRQDIADFLGLTIETVSRVVSKFKRDGLIALEGRHRVILRRMSDLLELAGEFDDAERLERDVPTQRSARWPH